MLRHTIGLALSFLSMASLAAAPSCNTAVQHSVDSAIIKYKIGYLVTNSNYVKSCSITFNNYDSILANVLSDDMEICDMAKNSQRIGDIVSIHYCYTGQDANKQPINTNPRIMSISTQNNFESSPD